MLEHENGTRTFGLPNDGGLGNLALQEVLPPEAISQAVMLARETLRENTNVVHANGMEYRSTVPSKEFYRNQWAWDSETVAMGLVWVDPDMAYNELRALVAGQWENGHIGHITYNPAEKSYYPQADRWRTEQFAQGEIISSGITQPPVLATSLEYIYTHSPDKDKADTFLAEMLPAVMKYHDYLHENRDPEQGGLLTVIHPWESGRDNVSVWDESLARIDKETIPQSVIEDVNANRIDDQVGESSHRPTNEQYYRYLGLVDMYAKMGWDEKRIVKESPFAIKDILFSSIWARSNESLANLLDLVGKKEEATKYRGYATQTQQAIAGTWSEEHQQHCDIDVAKGRHTPIVEPTNGMFASLYAGAVTDEQLPKVLSRLSDPEQFWTENPVPSYALNGPKFDLMRYWRGPTWPMTNFLIIEGLQRYAEESPEAKRLADALTEKTITMFLTQGFYEYYDPTNGAPREGRKDFSTRFGFKEFSWSAAIFLKLLADTNRLPQPLEIKSDRRELQAIPQVVFIAQA